MRILFLDGEDDPGSGPWSVQHWDRVVDLGIGGAQTYERWSERLHCEVEGLDFPNIEHEPVRDAFACGRGWLTDEYGIDWWETISAQYIQHVFRIEGLRKIAAAMGRRDEICFTRRGFDSCVLERYLGRTAVYFSDQASFLRSPVRRCRRVRRLSWPKIWQIIADKYDPDHRIRAHFAEKRAACETDVILLPSAYVNTTKMSLDYASLLPEGRFLVVSARKSGWAKSLPANVQQADLSAYAGMEIDEHEFENLCGRWALLRKELQSEPCMRVLLRTVADGSFTRNLRRWLAVRDAWNNVFAKEPITAVVSCDENNPYTRIPLLIGKQRGLASVACHHGALDGHRMIVPSRADVLLAKNKMEHDYLIRVCAVKETRVEICPPAMPDGLDAIRERSCIVFFSEDYEASAGRPEEFYRDILPSLVQVAQAEGKRLVVKLHPAESLADRRRLIRKVISRQKRSAIQIVEGPLTEEFMSNIWFAVTVVSTAALDCALRGIPVFLCGWLENWPYKYLEQFARGGVGVRLFSPAEISGLACRVENYNGALPQFWEPSNPSRFQQILSGQTASAYMAS